MRALIKGLPLDAAVFRSLPEHAGWTITDHLLASVIDTLGVVSHNVLVGPHADPKKLRKIKPPERVPRPSLRKPPRRRKATSDDLKRMFGGAAAFRPKEVSA